MCDDIIVIIIIHRKWLVNHQLLFPHTQKSNIYMYQQMLHVTIVMINNNNNNNSNSNHTHCCTYRIVTVYCRTKS